MQTFSANKHIGQNQRIKSEPKYTPLQQRAKITYSCTSSRASLGTYALWPFFFCTLSVVGLKQSESSNSVAIKWNIFNIFFKISLYNTSHYCFMPLTTFYVVTSLLSFSSVENRHGMSYAFMHINLLLDVTCFKYYSINAP